ncbi:ribosome recycling factor [Patescibacteria group bacterium]|nr:ribosome recycling factor [Patescibacteria group bacterium]
MDYSQIIDKIKPELQNLIEFLKGELMKIRTSRLSATLVEDIEVEVAGTRMPLKSLGAISSRSWREIFVEPWDKSYVEPIIAAIEKSGLGLTLVLEKDIIRLSAPPLTRERRKELLQVLSKKTEDTYQAIRKIRDKAWKEIQQGHQRGEIREDDKYKGKEKLEEMVGEYKDKIEEMVESKRKEIEG